MPGVQFLNDIDMNGFKVTEVGTATAGTDAVNLNQLNSSLGTFVQAVGDGAATAIVVTHNLNTRDVDVAVNLTASPFTGGFAVPWEATSVNSITLTFGAAPASGQYRVLVAKR